MEVIYREFVKEICSNESGVQEIISLEVNSQHIDYYYIGNEIEKSKVGVHGYVVFQVEYIEIGTLELKYIEFTKTVSDFIILKEPILDGRNPIKKITVEDKGFKLINKNNASINVSINILV